jgi:hydrogenase-4 component B
MGGLARVIPLTAVTFLVGAISICGLPPFNGFVSEFLIYKSFFRAGTQMHDFGPSLVRDYAPLVMLVAAVGLAFMGGLAVACFTKLYGIVFLGVNRSGDAPPRQSEQGWSSAVLLGLAALCAVIGIFPQTGLRLIAPALGELANAASAPPDWSAPLGQLQMVFALFLGLVLAVYAVKFWVQAGVGVRLRETWGCGYAVVTPRMQYTASGFAEELVKLGRPMLDLAVHWKPLADIVPVASDFRSHCHDRMEHGWLAFNDAVGRFLGAFRWIQSGNIRHYVVYLFGAILFYLLCALIWK